MIIFYNLSADRPHMRSANILTGYELRQLYCARQPHRRSARCVTNVAVGSYPPHRRRLVHTSSSAPNRGKRPRNKKHTITGTPDCVNNRLAKVDQACYHYSYGSPPRG